MYEYQYASVKIGGTLGARDDHRELIDRYASKGWRYVGYVPTRVVGYGALDKIDLIFEREV